MQKNNPACYECPKGKNKLHFWSPIMHEINGMVGAMCLHCSKTLTKEQAEDYGENDDSRMD